MRIRKFAAGFILGVPAVLLILVLVLISKFLLVFMAILITGILLTAAAGLFGDAINWAIEEIKK